MRDFVKALGIALAITLVFVAFIALVYVVDTRLSVKPLTTPSSASAPEITPASAPKAIIVPSAGLTLNQESAPVIQNTPSVGLALNQESVAIAHLYAKSGVVVSVNVYEDVVRFVDTRGAEWEFYGVEDWQVGDRLCAIFDDAGTLNPYDDAVIRATYEAWDY
jgi:hypothetical protein